MKKGLKLQFTRSNESKYLTIEKYDSINRIPISLGFIAGKLNDRPIYCENFCLGNLIELRFDRNSKQISELHLVEFNSADVRRCGAALLNKQLEGNFICSIIENESEMKTEFPMEILKTDSTLLIRWGEGYQDLIFYPLEERVSFGVNNDGYLRAVFLNKMSQEELLIFDY